MKSSLCFLIFNLLSALVFSRVYPNSKLNENRAISYCKSGQSPIDLNTCNDKQLNKLEWIGYGNMSDLEFKLLNTGKTVKLLMTSGTTPMIRGGPLTEDYVLAEIHFHWGSSIVGSEHSFNGTFGGLEAHILHFKKSYDNLTEALNHFDGAAIVGLIFKAENTSTSDIDYVINSLAQVTAVNAEFNISSAGLTWLTNYMEQYNYYSYHGSLTIPPYPEVATWIIPEKMPVVGETQLEEFRKLESVLGGYILANRRATQSLNGREVVCSVNC